MPVHNDTKVCTYHPRLNTAVKSSGAKVALSTIGGALVIIGVLGAAICLYALERHTGGLIGTIATHIGKDGTIALLPIGTSIAVVNAFVLKYLIGKYKENINLRNEGALSPKDFPIKEEDFKLLQEKDLLEDNQFNCFELNAKSGNYMNLNQPAYCIVYQEKGARKILLFPTQIHWEKFRQAHLQNHVACGTVGGKNSYIEQLISEAWNDEKRPRPTTPNTYLLLTDPTGMHAIAWKDKDQKLHYMVYTNFASRHSALQLLKKNRDYTIFDHESAHELKAELIEPLLSEDHIGLDDVYLGKNKYFSQDKDGIYSVMYENKSEVKMIKYWYSKTARDAFVKGLENKEYKIVKLVKNTDY